MANEPQQNILSANQLFSLIDMKRKFINSDNHKFHQYQIKQLPFILTELTTFKNISVTTFVAEIGVPSEIHRPVASH
jgi:hypothetical protein